MKKWNEEDLSLTETYKNKKIIYKFEEKLEEVNSRFHNIKVLKHKKFGNVLLCDNDVMSASKDYDKDYDSAIIKLLPHKIEKVLIFGGGDCSLANKLEKNNKIKKIVIVDIDPIMVRLFKKYFYSAKTSKKTKIIYSDIFSFMNNSRYSPDVVIDDLTENIFKEKENYYFIIAKRYSGKYIISQTGSPNDNSKKRIEKINSFSSYVKTKIVLVRNYKEKWTFTKYKL